MTERSDWLSPVMEVWLSGPMLSIGLTLAAFIAASGCLPNFGVRCGCRRC